MIDEAASQTAYRIHTTRRLNWPYPHQLLQDVLPGDRMRRLIQFQLMVRDGQQPEARATGA